MLILLLRNSGSATPAGFKTALPLGALALLGTAGTAPTFLVCWANGRNHYLEDVFMQKNTASQKIGVQMVSATDGSAFTGAVTVYVTGDAGTQAVGSVGAGACTHEGNGYHTYAPAQAETNYDLIAFTFTGTGAVPTTIQVSTAMDANVLRVAGTTQTAGDIIGDTNDIQSRLPATLGANGNIKSDVRDLLGTAWLTPAVAGTPDVNAKQLGGTAQTGRDIGASVLLSAGTGTGQLDFTAGVVKANVTQFGGSAGTFASGRPEVNVTHFGGTAGTFAAGRPETNMTHIAGASVTTSSAQIGVNVVNAGGTAWASGSLTSGVFAAGAINAAAIATDAIGAAGLAADAVTEIRSLASGTSDSGSTTTMVDAARTEADTDYWKGATIVFTSGNIAGQARRITGFTPGTDTITFAPAVTQAVATQTYEIWPEGRADVGLWNGTVVPTEHTAGYPVITIKDGTGTGEINTNAGAVAVVDSVTAIATGGITAGSIATDAIGAAELAADAVTEIQSGLATAANLATLTGYVDTEVAAIKAVTDQITFGTANRVNAQVYGMEAATITAAAVATNAIDADALAADAVTEIWAGSTAPTAATIADAVWDEDATAHQTQGTFGQAIGDPGADTNTLFKAVVTDAAGATVGVDVVAIKAETASIQSDTNDLQTQIGTAGAGLTNINLPDQTMNITGDITGNLSGSVGSVTGAVGSVTGNVGGNVTGSVGSVATGGITAASIAADAIGASELAADAVAEIADAVWDEVLSGHLTAGTTGNALNAAGSAGDPWSTTLPGAYGAGSAGKIIGDNLNATVSSRASQTSLDTLDDYVDTEVSAIKAKTDQLTFGTANRVDAQVYGIETGAVTAGAIATDAIGAAEIAADAVTEIQSGLATAASLSTVAGYIDTEVASILAAVDTEVAAIKTKTDQLTFTVANQVDSNALTGGGGLDAAGVRSAIGMASANLDTQLDALPTAAENATATWASGTRTLTSFGTLVADIATAIWAAGTRTLSAFGFTVDTNANATETAIKAKTDSLTFTVAGEVDANIQSVNDTTVAGTGANGDEWGPV